MSFPAHRHYVRDYHADTERQLFVDEVRSGGYDGEIVVADDLIHVQRGQLRRRRTVALLGQ